MGEHPPTPNDPHALRVTAQVLDLVALALDVWDNEEARETILSKEVREWHECHCKLLVGMVVADMRRGLISAEVLRNQARTYRNCADVYDQ